MKERIVLITDAWGTKFGGINAFNTDLCISLAELLQESYEVVCAVLAATPEEVNDARGRGVKLVPLEVQDRSSLSNEDWVSRIIEGFANQTVPVKWWIGHDIVSGPIAVKVATQWRCPAAVVHHMNYEAYVSYQLASRKAAQDKIQLQKDVLSVADVVFAVGPKLAESARDKVSSTSRTQVVELLPGIAKVEGMPMPSRFSAITFGRIDESNDILKQARLAVASFGLACRSQSLGPDPSLTVIGISEESRERTHASLFKLAEQYARRAVQIHAFPYLHDRPRLLNYLRRQSVCLMLSIHEGFGLVGWEAIAAEVPLIVSRNSGLFEAVDNLLAGTGTGCLTPIDVLGSVGKQSFREEDVETVALAIQNVRRREERAKQNARFLKTVLGHLCTWQQTAITVAATLELNSPQSTAMSRLSRWRPEMLLDAFLYSDETVQAVVTRRQDLFERIWDALKEPSRITRRLIFFGGIATALSDDKAVQRYAHWLQGNPNAKLYICYESGPAARARAHKLDEEKLEDPGDLPTAPQERMLEKERRVSTMKNRLARRTERHVRESVLARVHLISLKEPLATYIIVGDEEVHLTPTFQTRSSQTLTFQLRDKPPQFRSDVYAFIVDHLSRLEGHVEATALIKELRDESI